MLQQEILRDGAPKAVPQDAVIAVNRIGRE
jgi:hypothetical protein